MNEQDKKNVPFGLWPSPISASLISQRLRLEDVQFAGDGQTLVWCEGRSAGSALAAQGVDGSSARRDLTSEQNPRGGVGYGGGVFSVSGETVLFANRDGRIYRRGLGYDRPRPITPAFGPSPSGAAASPALSPDGRWVVYVYSDGHDDLLALADSSGKEWPVQLSRGADFYMQPTWHPAGDRLAWVEWDHPNMPWDGTRIQIARLEGSPPRVVDVTTAAGGADLPAQQPLFSPDGRWLCYSVETGEFPDLMLMDLQTGERRVLVHGDGFEVVPPAWVQGVRSIGWSPSSQRIFYIRYTGSNSSLWVADLATGEFYLPGNRAFHLNDSACRFPHPRCRRDDCRGSQPARTDRGLGKRTASDPGLFNRRHLRPGLPAHCQRNHLVHDRWGARPRAVLSTDPSHLHRRRRAASPGPHPRRPDLHRQ